MDARTLPLPFDPAALRGLSTALLDSHHRNNYGGAVTRLNALRKRLAATAFATAPGFELNGLKREELIATNSMLLHELYFASLGGAGADMEPAMRLALDADFGSAQRWRDEFVALGKALGGGSGWVLLVFQPRDGTLVNQWAADHTHALAGGVPVLALDMYELLTTSISGRRRRRMSMPSWQTSTGPRSIGATSTRCMTRAMRSVRRTRRWPARSCSTSGAPRCSSNRPRSYPARCGAIRRA